MDASPQSELRATYEAFAAAEFERLFRAPQNTITCEGREDCLPNVEPNFNTKTRREVWADVKPGDVILPRTPKRSAKGLFRWPIAVEWKPRGMGFGMSTWKDTGEVALFAYVRWIDNKGRHHAERVSMFNAMADWKGPLPEVSATMAQAARDVQSRLRNDAWGFLRGHLNCLFRSALYSDDLSTEDMLALIHAIPRWRKEFEMKTAGSSTTEPT